MNTVASQNRVPLLGLYLHLPFCPSRCPYCDFFAARFAPGPAKGLIEAICGHLAKMTPLAKGRGLDTVYLGGGTPSMWPAASLARLLDTADRCLGINQGAEITLEANPGTLGGKKLAALAGAGFNRLSVGAQSMDDAALSRLGRLHRAQDTVKAARAARQAGFVNLNLDLIYGLPDQSARGHLADLAALLELEPEHVSLYELTLGPGTPFAARLQKGRPPLPGEEEVAAMEAVARGMLAEAGFTRYEISNFARPGFACRHNLATWEGGDYLAAGPGAHGHLAGVRWAWAPDVAGYIAGAAHGDPPLAFEEKLSQSQRALEVIMLGLRTAAGVDLDLVAGLLRKDPMKVYQEAMDQLTAREWAVIESGHLVPTAKGLEMADAAAALFA